MKLNWLWRTCLICPSIFAFQSLEAQTKPNIIFILADDLGYGDLGCYGQKMIQTPNIDLLAAGGIRFTDYYSGSTVCAPSRECLLTGFHTGHTAIRGNFRLPIDDGNLPIAKDHPTVVEYLKSQGYQTGLFGKWGVGDSSTGPNTRGFDYSLCYLDQVKAHDYYPPYIWENDKRLVLKENENGKKGIYSHDLFANKTLDYILNIKKNKPFFLYLPYTIPHGGYELPPEEPYKSKDWSQQYKVYATMISKLDKDIGRIVQLLKEKGLTDNTIIFFSSDNGANMGMANFFKSNGSFSGSKFGLNEGGIRVPLIAYWPGKIKKAQVTNHVAAAWDVLPTICQIVGVKPRIAIDGISFLPTLLGGKQAEHPYLYWEFYDYNYNFEVGDNKLPRNWLESRATRMGKWKGEQTNMYKNPNALIELYDLEVDPGEKKNVAKEYPEIVGKVKKIFETSTVADPPNFPFKK